MRSGTMIGPRSGSGAEEFTEQPLGGNGALSNHAWRLAGEVEYRRGSSQHTGPVEHHVDAVADKRRRLPPAERGRPPGEVGAAGHQWAPHRPQQSQGNTVVGHPDAQGAVSDDLAEAL